ncbi:hypothetical protein QN277_020469 [Acacia crassicarpa]|uniref:Uncharacterized protein n=1 Tax=Acacia crassicarpa TaxID=499986 RepID=A0AAE1JJU5_9FABA|nr:hypothetical protein QN277_020469 [Acacia crassicarpa]
MNSLIHFSQSPVSVAREGISSASRVHVNLLNHGSLSVSQCCKRSQLVSRPLYVKRALERFSEGPKMKEENGKKMMKNNIMRGVGTASLVMACVLGSFTLSGKMNLKPNIAYAAWYYQVKEGSVTGPLKKLMTRGSFKREREPDGNEIEALKLYAMAVSKDDPKGAQEILSKERENWDGEANEKLLLALVELLVYQGEHEEAKKKIDELLEAIGSGPAAVPIARIYLLKAIAESESDPTKAAESREAKEAWENYHSNLSDPFYGRN